MLCFTLNVKFSPIQSFHSFLKENKRDFIINHDHPKHNKLNLQKIEINFKLIAINFNYAIINNWY